MWASNETESEPTMSLSPLLVDSVVTNSDEEQLHCYLCLGYGAFLVHRE